MVHRGLRRAVCFPLPALLAILSALAASPAQASNMKEMMGYLLVTAMPTRPIAPGNLDVNFSPAYDQYRYQPSCSPGPCLPAVDREWKLNGFGAAASALYALSPHWAVAGMFGYGELSGTDGTGATARSTGYVATANAVFEPVTGKDFNVPIMAGLGYRNLTENADGFGGQIFAAKGLAMDAGVAPQFNTGPLRWIFFGYLFTGEPSVRTMQASGLASSPAENIGGGAGLRVTYRPWNIGITYIPASTTDVAADHGESNNVYALSYQHRFLLARTAHRRESAPDAPPPSGQ